MIKNLLAMQKIWVQSLVGKIPGEGNGYSLQYSCLENSMNRGAWRTIVQGVTNLYTHTTCKSNSVTDVCMYRHTQVLRHKRESAELEQVTELQTLKQKGLISKAFLMSLHYRQSYPVILRACLFSLGLDMSKVYKLQ